MNKINRLKLYLLAFIIGGIVSCENIAVKERGNGNIETKEIDLDSFKKLKLSGAFEVHIEEGSSPMLRIVTDENLMKYIEAKVKGGKLDIYTTDPISSKEGIKLYLNYVSLEEIELSGAVSLSNDEALKAEELNLNMSGAGSMELELSVDELYMYISGAGAVELGGDVNSQTINMSGAGGLDAYDLKSVECDINISGVGGANLYVTEKLYANVSGIGSINYRGNPSDVSTDISGLGSVDRKD